MSRRISVSCASFNISPALDSVPRLPLPCFFSLVLAQGTRLVCVRARQFVWRLVVQLAWPGDGAALPRPAVVSRVVCVLCFNFACFRSPSPSGTQQNAYSYLDGSSGSTNRPNQMVTNQWRVAGLTTGNVSACCALCVCSACSPCARPAFYPAAIPLCQPLCSACPDSPSHSALLVLFVFLVLRAGNCPNRCVIRPVAAFLISFRKCSVIGAVLLFSAVRDETGGLNRLALSSQCAVRRRPDRPDAADKYRRAMRQRCACLPIPLTPFPLLIGMACNDGLPCSALLCASPRVPAAPTPLRIR